MPTIVIEEQIACIERELGMRVKLYPRWVKGGKLTQEAADQELDRLRAVLLTLQRVQQGLDHQVPGAEQIREGERARVLCTLLPMVHSDVYMGLQRKLKALNP